MIDLISSVIIISLALIAGVCWWAFETVRVISLDAYEAFKKWFKDRFMSDKAKDEDNSGGCDG